MSEERVDKLEALLQRVRRNAATPRAPSSPPPAPSNGDHVHALGAAPPGVEAPIAPVPIIDLTSPDDAPETARARATIQLASSIPPPIPPADDDDEQSTAVRQYQAEVFDIGDDDADPESQRRPSQLPSVPPAQPGSRPSPLVQAVMEHAESQSLDGVDRGFNLMPPPPRLPPISLPQANPEVFGAEARVAADAAVAEAASAKVNAISTTPPHQAEARARPTSSPPQPISSPPPRGDRSSRIELEDLEDSLRPPAPSAPPPALLASEPPSTHDPAKEHAPPHASEAAHDEAAHHEPALALSQPEDVVDVDDEAELYDDEPDDLVAPSVATSAGDVATSPPRALLSFDESPPGESPSVGQAPPGFVQAPPGRTLVDDHDDDDAASDVRDVSTKPPPSQEETVDVADVDAIENELLAARPIDLDQIEAQVPPSRPATYPFEDEDTSYGSREADGAAEPRTLPPGGTVDTDEHAPASSRQPRESGRPPSDPGGDFDELSDPPPESGEVPSEAASRLAAAREAEALDAQALDEAVMEDALLDQAVLDEEISNRPTPAPSRPTAATYDDPMAERTAEVTAMGRVDIVDRTTIAQDVVVTMVSGGFRTSSETFGEVLADALSFGD